MGRRSGTRLTALVASALIQYSSRSTLPVTMRLESAAWAHGSEAIEHETRTGHFLGSVLKYADIAFDLLNSN